MVLESIEVKNFRNLPAAIYPLGKRLTIIAGHNATGKSSLLGLIAQPFGLSSEVDIWDNALSSKFETKFRLSLDFDKFERENRYIYYINTYEALHPEGRCVPVKLYRRKENIQKRVEKSPLRFVTGATRGAGSGNIDIPVIYLGLRRVYPLGETINPSIKDDDLTSEERSFYVERYRRILQDITQNITPQRYEAGSDKRTLGITTTDYDSTGISAGQDNLGQILGAIISLFRVKRNLGTNYKGALLLIDEADVTLHAASQKKLVELLFEESQKNNIQIVLTTHSFDLIDYAQNYHTIGTNGLAVWYLSKPHGRVQLALNPDAKSIRENLYLESQNSIVIPKVNIYVEDAEAELFLKKILSKKRNIQKYLKITALKLGYGKLVKLATTVIPETQQCIFIIDGDQKISPKYPQNLLALPGGKSPEKVFGQYLDRLSPEDNFWTDQYSKQHFLAKYPRDDQNRDQWKHWFNGEKGHWGDRGMSRLYQRWKIDNQCEIDKLIGSIMANYNKIATIRNMPTL